MPALFRDKRIKFNFGRNNGIIMGRIRIKLPLVKKRWHPNNQTSQFFQIHKHDDLEDTSVNSTTSNSSKGSDYNFTMFFQLELGRMGEGISPHQDRKKKSQSLFRKEHVSL